MNKINNKKFRYQSKKPDNRVGINIQSQISENQTGLHNNIFIFSSPLNVLDFASKINKTASEIIKTLFMKGVSVTLNSILSKDQIGELCLEFGYDFETREEEITEDNILENLNVVDKEEDLFNRAPIVTIMGHVDHGKTSLLDRIRVSNVISSESGGITQHIGAYQVVHNDKKITFIDTPGHEAFTKMRARGAKVTDIVILVIAADDGMRPQTVEALNHAKAANVKIIVFINKMDKPDAKPDLVKSQLADHKLLVEEFGGDVLVVTGSAKNGDGIPELLESILFVAELMNLRANPNRLAYGTTIESNLDKGYGPVVTLIVENGTLHKGDYLVVGNATGKVRILRNDLLQMIPHALPSMPVKVAGLTELPQAGDRFIAFKNEKAAKWIAAKISEKKWKEHIFNLLNHQNKNNEQDGIKKVNIILKTDVHGSLEAIQAMLDRLVVDGAQLTILNSNTGSINESDLQLAKVSNAVIFGFNVKPLKNIRDIAEGMKVPIRFQNVIYHLVDEVKQLLLGSLEPIIIEEIIGEAEVLALWKHSKIGTIAGCRVISGKITRNAQARLIRDGIVIYTSKISSLKHLKEDAKEVLINKECGLTLENFQDIKENDIVEVFELKKKSITDSLIKERKQKK